jgi:hypothetical protein
VLEVTPAYDNTCFKQQEDCADQAIALIRKLQDLPPPLTAQAKFLLLSRSLQRRLTHFSRVVRPPLSLGPLAKLQGAVENAAFALLNLPSNPDTAATMGLHHPLVRMQLWLPLREGGFGLNATGVVPDSSAAEYHHSLSLHTASFLAAAAHCHDALPQAHPSLRPFSQLHFVLTGTYAASGPSLCASLWRTPVRSNPALHPAEPLALPPDPSIIPVSADTVTWQVRAARPVLSQALTQCSATELFQACEMCSHEISLNSAESSCSMPQALEFYVQTSCHSGGPIRVES